MKRLSIIALTLTLAALLTGCAEPSSRNDADPETARLLDTLDAVLTRHDDIIAEKERHIARLKSLDKGLAPQARYNLYDNIFNEYYSYDFDSASHYAALKREEALKSGDRAKASVAALNKARADIARGRDMEAATAMASASADTAIAEVALPYLDLLTTIADASPDSLLRLYDRKIALLDSGTPAWVYNETGRLRASGKPHDALETIARHRDTLDATPRDRAISRFIAGELQRELGDTVGAMRSFAQSAINDIITPVRDYSSLYELAAMLFDAGDIDRAYRYITFAAKDHYASNVNSNVIAANKLMPNIAAAHNSRTANREHRQRLLIVAVSVLALTLIAVSLWLYAAYRATQRAAREKSALNEQLTDATAQLSTLNARLAESNTTKDAYIVQYLSLCSYYIECVDRYRNNLRAVARNKGVEEMLYMLNSTTSADKELKEFYNSFDSTFLKLFPDFIDRFNDLLQPDKRLTVRPGELLTTELRVFALIRLGVRDSEQIASFLRRSLSTVYNYRVKMRNASRFPRQDFEEMVANIG